MLQETECTTENVYGGEEEISTKFKWTISFVFEIWKTCFSYII